MKKILLVAAAALLCLIVYAVPCTAAYTIDGNLTDWGLAKLQDNSYDWGSELTWLPADSIRFIVEDNYDPKNNNSGSYTGVHIKGVGSSYSEYHELQRTHKYTGNEVNEPFGGEYYDLEARYMDQDDDYLYIAIVTSLNPEEEGDRRPGDLALNIDLSSSTGDLGYEYGVWIHADPLQGTIFENPVWEKKGYLLPVLPDRILTSTGTAVGNAEIAYNNDWLTRQDWGKDNYVIEIAVPKDVLGLSSGERISEKSVMYCDNCINEHIFVPEFPTIAVSLAMITGLLSMIYFINSKKHLKS